MDVAVGCCTRTATVITENVLLYGELLEVSQLMLPTRLQPTSKLAPVYLVAGENIRASAKRRGHTRQQARPLPQIWKWARDASVVLQLIKTWCEFGHVQNEETLTSTAEETREHIEGISILLLTAFMCS